MVTVQGKTNRKPSGKIKKEYRKKRLFEIGRRPSFTKLSETKRVVIRAKGGDSKQRLLGANIANVLDTKSKKYHKAKIITVSDNPANRHYVRRNIITKGTIIETEKGKARVTSRPGQDGIVNAVLV